MADSAQDANTPPSAPNADDAVVDKIFALAVPKDIPEPKGALNIETLEEFILEVYHKDPNSATFQGWTFTDIDFSKYPFDKATWFAYDFTGAVFYGCILPDFDNVRDFRDRGAFFLQQFDGIPFKAMRAFMYSQKELQQHDADIYKFYLEKDDLHSRMLEQMHDHFMQDALFDYLDGKTVVAVMGGHAMQRGSSHYQDIAHICWDLANKGFVIASGGGPGAMEAANLGAYMYQNTKDELKEALHILASTPDPDAANEYMNTKAPKEVVKVFGYPTHQPSLSIPTWKYGHEPSNMFATWICKLFSNAIREDGLLEIANGGIIYTPGSAGTRQEIFQAACTNHYADEGKEKPTVFYDTNFWGKSGIPEVLRNASSDRPFAKHIVEYDSPDKIIEYLEKFRESRNLPRVTAEALKSNYWVRGPLRALSQDFSGVIRAGNLSATPQRGSVNRANTETVSLTEAPPAKEAQKKVPIHHRMHHFSKISRSPSMKSTGGGSTKPKSNAARAEAEWISAKKKRERHAKKRKQNLKQLCNDFTAVELGLDDEYTC